MSIRRNLAKKEVIKESTNIDNKKESSFTEDEATFLISKLREANYKGTEFETFYKVMSKLALLAENK
jgi:hypothetical protein|tara:strand:- start:148 stop:348 length:201 start_codon:yes stop_codon:yes gene_type:complete